MDLTDEQIVMLKGPPLLVTNPFSFGIFYCDGCKLPCSICTCKIETSKQTIEVEFLKYLSLK